MKNIILLFLFTLFSCSVDVQGPAEVTINKTTPETPSPTPTIIPTIIPTPTPTPISINPCLAEGDIWPTCPILNQTWTNTINILSFTGSIYNNSNFLMVINECSGLVHYNPTNGCEGMLTIFNMPPTCDSWNNTYNYVNCNGLFLCLGPDETCNRYEVKE